MASDQLTTDDVAELAGITAASLRRQRIRGVVPEPDGMLGRTPWWRRETIEEWLAVRPGRGRPTRPRAQGAYDS